MFSHLVLSIIPCKTNKHFYWRNANRFARNCEENITSNLKDIILIRSANEPWIVFILKVSYFVSVYEELWYQWLLALSTINQRVASRVSKVSTRIFLTANYLWIFSRHQLSLSFSRISFFPLPSLQCLKLSFYSCWTTWVLHFSNLGMQKLRHEK